MSWVWENSRAKSPGDRLTLLAIADNAEDDGSNAFPGLKLLGVKTSLSRSQVLRCIERLVGLGELEVAKAGGGRSHKTVYRVMMKGSQVATVSEEEGSQDDTVPEPERVSSGAVKGVIEGGAYKEKNHPSEPPKPTAGRKRTTRPPSANGKTTSALLAQYLESLSDRPPAREVGQLAKTINGLLDEGIASGLIWQTLDQDYRHRDVGPGYLPNLVAARQRGAVRSPNGNGSDRRPPPEIPEADLTSRPPRHDPVAMMAWSDRQLEEATRT